MALIFIVLVATAAWGDSQHDPWLSTDIAAPNIPDEESREVIRRDHPTQTTQHDGKAILGSGKATSAWMRSTLSLTGVVALILVLAYVSKKFNFASRGRRVGMIQVLSRVNLSSRQSLCLVRYGPRAVLLGITNDRINALDVVSDPELTADLAGDALRGASERATDEFRRRLTAESSAYSESEEGDDADVARGGIPQLQALKSKLAGTIRRIRSARAG
jgi:flagellar biosynthetic protein FliO